MGFTLASGGSSWASVGMDAAQHKTTATNTEQQTPNILACLFPKVDSPSLLPSWMRLVAIAEPFPGD